MPRRASKTAGRSRDTWADDKVDSQSWLGCLSSTLGASSFFVFRSSLFPRHTVWHAALSTVPELPARSEALRVLVPSGTSRRTVLHSRFFPQGCWAPLMDHQLDANKEAA